MSTGLCIFIIGSLAKHKTTTYYSPSHPGQMSGRTLTMSQIRPHCLLG